MQLSGFGINCQLMLSCPLPLRRSSLDWQAARQLRRHFRDICPVFICTSARFYQLQGLGCYRLSQALHAHLSCTTLLNSEDLCIIGTEEWEREKLSSPTSAWGWRDKVRGGGGDPIHFSRQICENHVGDHWSLGPGWDPGSPWPATLLSATIVALHCPYSYRLGALFYSLCCFWGK